MLLDQLEEYNDHYRGCYFKIKVDEEWETVYAEGTDRPEYLFQTYVPEEQRYIRLTRVQGNTEVDLQYPSLGLINTDTDVRYVTRKPVRQYRKAYRNDSHRFSMLPCVKKIALQYRVRGRPAPISNSDKGAVTHHIFENIYYTIGEAKELIMSGERLAVAITPRFAISLNLTNLEHYTIYYKDYLVGLLNKETNVLSLLPSYDHLTSDLRMVLGTDNIETISFTTESITNEPF